LHLGKIPGADGRFAHLVYMRRVRYLSHCERLAADTLLEVS